MSAEGATADAELKAIHAVARASLDGMVYADEARLRSAFHPLAAVVGHARAGLEWDTMGTFVAVVLRDGGLPSGTSYRSRLVCVYVTGDLAVVKLTDDYLGSRHTDYLTMLRHEGRWAITHKAFYEHGGTRRA